MKAIRNVKLGFNKNAEVTVVSDVEMKNENDIDSLFLCFFTILNPPLRLSVITAGSLNEHLARILLQLKEPNRVGVCIDTCHIFAAGYDFRTRQGFFHTLEEVEKVIGLAKVKAFHLNDSKRELGSRVDRHDHIGKGCIGLEAFRLLVNEKCFDELPMILETPGGEEHYRDNLEKIRNLIK